MKEVLLIFLATSSNNIKVNRVGVSKLRARDIDVDVEKLRAQAHVSMSASYIANYIYCTNTNF